MNNNGAFYASPKTAESSECSMDSGAINHITVNPSNSSQKHDYNGGDKLMIGNGQDLHIKHIGSSLLHSKHGHVTLNNMLHVSHIAKNLLSVS